MSTVDVAHIVLKVAEVCNLGCKYCYFFEGGDDSYARDPAFLAPEVIEQTGRFLAAGVAELGLSTVEISLHGGEPLMMGKRRFAQLCQILHRHISPVAHLNLMMQTNATLLDDEWVDLLSAYQVGIGVSLDGPPHVNDRYRINKRGGGSYAEVIKGIEILRKAQDRGLLGGFGVGCVIDPDSDAAETYRHFVHTLGFQTIGYRPPIMDWTNFDARTAQKIASYYEALVAAWVQDNNPKVRVKFLSFVLGALMSDTGALSTANAMINMTRSITVRSNGDLCPDDALQPKEPRFRDTGFNVNNCSLGEFHRASFWQSIDTPARGLESDCRDCQWLGICRGGPAEERYLGNGEFSSKTVYCGMRKNVYQSLYSLVASSLGYDTLDRRLASTRPGEAALQ